MKLEKLKFSAKIGRSLIVFFSKYTACPSLGELVIESDELDHWLLCDMIKNNENLKTLECPDHMNVVYPEEEISEKLETLKIGICGARSLRSLTGKLPNLKHLQARFWKPNVWDSDAPMAPGDYRYGNVTPYDELMDKFLASCPKLESLVSHECTTEFGSPVYGFQSRSGSWIGGQAFWQLTSLRKLCIIHYNYESGWFGDNVFIKLASCFPHMEVLVLDGDVRSDKDAHALASLKKLRHLILLKPFESWTKKGEPAWADDARHPKVDWLETLTKIAIMDFIILVRDCPSLQYLAINEVENEPHYIPITAQDAANIAKSFFGFNSTSNLTIHIHDKKQAEIWKSEEVGRVLKELEEAEGRVIKFE